MAVPYLADYVVVDVLDADRRLRRLGAAHADPALEPRLAAAVPFTFEPGTESPLAAVLASGDATLVREVTDEWLAARPRDAQYLGAARCGRRRSCWYHSGRAGVPWAPCASR